MTYFKPADDISRLISESHLREKGLSTNCLNNINSNNHVQTWINWQRVQNKHSLKFFKNVNETRFLIRNNNGNEQSVELIWEYRIP